MSRRRKSSPAAAHLRDQLATAGTADATPMPSFETWSQMVPEPKAGPLDFKRFPFQVELYRAGSDERELVVKKAAQVGVSTYCIRWALYWAARGLSALYVFPREAQLRDFSDARIKRTVEVSPVLQALMPSRSTGNKGLRQVGDGFLYLRGSESMAALQAVDADVLVLDEYDDLVQNHVPDAERRLGASELGLVRRVGVPRYPGFGVADEYDRSDRRQWFVRCGGCNLRQLVTFENVDVDRLARVCTKCRRELDVGDGEWVAEFPDRAVRGYHVSRLIVPGADLGQLIRAERETDPARRQAFVNKDLGEPYAPEDARLSSQFIEAARRPYSCSVAYDGSNLVTMGVDVASVRQLHVRVSEHFDDFRKRALFIGAVDGFADLDELMDRYRVTMCAIDAHPERLSASAFAERFPGRVYLVTYGDSETGDPLRVHEEDRRVGASRTEAIDAALSGIRRQHNLLPDHLPPEYVRHLQAAVRVVEPDALGRRRARYRSLGADDFLHAEVYDSIARDLLEYRFEVARLRAQFAPVIVPIKEALPGFVPFSERDPYDYYPGPGGDAYAPGPEDYVDEFGEW